MPAQPAAGASSWPPAEVRTLPELARVLRELRRRHARQRGGAAMTYRELAAVTGWSHGIIGEYLAGRILPPTDRFDELVRLLGATPSEQGALATVRDQVEESRRQALPGGAAIDEARVPRQLPLDVFGFTGRAAQLAQLDALLDRAAPPICVVTGTAGVGKTALAVHWAHRVADQFPGGQLYLDLRGYDDRRPLPVADALASFLRGLGVGGVDIPGDVVERSAMLRTVLAGRRALIVLDNVAGVDQVRPLLPGAPSCRVLVTSRDDLAGLVARDGAVRVDLDLFTGPEAVTLLRTLIGPGVDDAAETATALAERCARLPLALRIAAEFAVGHPGSTLADLLDELRDEQRRLDLFDAAGDPRTAVRSVFSWSYQHLGPAGARAFALLGLHPGRDVEPYALAALAGVAVLPEARALLDALIRAHLIEATGAGRYAMHDLLRAYAGERAAALSPHETRAARARLFDAYLHTADAAVRTLFPHDRRHALPGPPPTVPMPPVDQPEPAAAWLERERPTLVAVARHAADHGWSRHSVALSRVLWRHFEAGGHYQEALSVHRDAVRATDAVAPDDSIVDGRADALANLGSVHWWLGDHRPARTYFERSLAGHRATGDAAGEALALARLGLVHERLGDYPAALAHLRDALELYRRGGDRYGEGAQLINVGGLFRRLARYDEAADHQRRAAVIFAGLGDLRLEGYALGNLGAVCGATGRHADALAHLEQALTNCRACGDPGGEGSALATIGAVYLRLGRHPEALDHLHRALAISRQTADRCLETETLNTLGETLRALHRPGSAFARHRSARELAGQAGDRFETARAVEGIAEALADLGRADESAHHRQQALAMYLALGLPDAQRVRSRLTHLTG